MIKSIFIFAAALLQILIGGAHLADFLSQSDPSNVDPKVKAVVESLAESRIPLPMGMGTRTYAELHDGFSALYAILMLTVGGLNCAAAPACRHHRGLHVGLVLVNLVGMLGVLWACATYLMIFPGIVCVAAAVVMFFSLFITSRGAEAGR